MLRETEFWHHNYILVFPCQTFNHPSLPRGRPLSTPHLTRICNQLARPRGFQEAPGLLKAPGRLGAARYSSNSICSGRFSFRPSAQIDCQGFHPSVLRENFSFTLVCRVLLF